MTTIGFVGLGSMGGPMAQNLCAAGLGDFGADAGISEPPLILLPAVVADAAQAFVKFLGEGHNRVPLSFSTFEEIERADCHWSVAYPASKRPSGVRDDAVIFIARLTQAPNDISVFGRAIGLRHVPGRDIVLKRIFNEDSLVRRSD